MASRLTAAMELFSCRAIAVGDRYLDVGDVAGEVGSDFAQVTVPLSWQDDRELPEDASVPAKEIVIEIEMNKEE